MAETEFAWVIEEGQSDTSKPRYWTGEYVKGPWSHDNLSALRFARREDAYTLYFFLCRNGHMSDTDKHRICEHGWIDG